MLRLWPSVATGFRSSARLLQTARVLASQGRESYTSRKISNAASTQKLVLTQKANGVATFTLKDDKKRNALSSSMMSELVELLESHEADQSVKVVVIRHEGSVFSSGHDLKELQSTEKVLGTTEPIFQLCCNLMTKVQSARFPVIAEVSGLATAGGCQLVAACDLAIAADTATFSTPGVRIGLFCTTPGTTLSRVVPAKVAMEMLLTGKNISAKKAMEVGLVNQVVAPDQLRETTAKLAEEIAQASHPMQRHSIHSFALDQQATHVQAPGETVAIGKRAFYTQLHTPDMKAAYEYAKGVMVDNMHIPDAKEGIDAFVTKRQPNWT